MATRSLSSASIHPAMPAFAQRVVWVAADLRNGGARYVEAYDVTPDTTDGRRLRAEYQRVTNAALAIIQAEGITVRQRWYAGHRLAWTRDN